MHVILLPLTLLACVEPDADDPTADTGTTDTGPNDDSAQDSAADSGDAPAPLDRDADGATEDVDCDDRDAAVFPGATEIWNELDDDCDGVADADGAWSGTLDVSASAVYEGRRYDYRLACPFQGTRADGRFDFTATCAPDPDDATAQRLLGATLVATPEDPRVSGERWSDSVTFTSSNGWDSRGEGSVVWSGFDGAAVDLSLSGVSLTARETGTITRAAR